MQSLMVALSAERCAWTLLIISPLLTTDSRHEQRFTTHCVQVREATTLLDIDVLFYPCPKGGPTWRPKVRLPPGFFVCQQYQALECPCLS